VHTLKSRLLRNHGIGRGSGFVAVEIPFTPRAKRVLELSLEEARQLGERPGCIYLISLQCDARMRTCMHALCLAWNMCKAGVEGSCKGIAQTCMSSAGGIKHVHGRTVDGSRMDLLNLGRPQLHRHGAHPAGPAARGRGRRRARAGDPRRGPLQDPYAGTLLRCTPLLCCALSSRLLYAAMSVCTRCMHASRHACIRAC
jgi:hypothetical protein